jgi:hypothetical protein
LDPTPPGAQTEPGQPLRAHDGHEVGVVPPPREAPLLDAQEPELVGSPQRSLGRGAADPRERGQVLQGKTAGAPLAHLRGHHGQDRRLGESEPSSQMGRHSPTGGPGAAALHGSGGTGPGAHTPLYSPRWGRKRLAHLDERGQLLSLGVSHLTGGPSSPHHLTYLGELHPRRRLDGTPYLFREHTAPLRVLRPAGRGGAHPAIAPPSMEMVVSILTRARDFGRVIAAKQMTFPGPGRLSGPPPRRAVSFSGLGPPATARSTAPPGTLTRRLGRGQRLDPLSSLRRR